MRRTTIAVVLSLVMVLGTIGAASAGAVSGGSVGFADAHDASAAENGSEMAPGEQFSGSVSVGEAEAEGEIDARAFDKRAAAADGDDALAGVVADQLNRSEERLAALQDRREELSERHDAGEITDREYRVRTAKLAAETASVERMANRSADAAAGIPTDILAANGVDAERIGQLRENASELRGGEVAEIAQGIAGGGAGGAPNAPAGERGPNSAGSAADAGGQAGDAGGENASDGENAAAGAAGDGTSDGSEDEAPSETETETPGGSDEDGASEATETTTEETSDDDTSDDEESTADGSGDD